MTQFAMLEARPAPCFGRTEARDGIEGTIGIIEIT
jgi:hypothetical protein